MIRSAMDKEPSDLADRLDRFELTLAEVVHRIDDVLGKLDDR